MMAWEAHVVPTRAMAAEEAFAVLRADCVFYEWAVGEADLTPQTTVHDWIDYADLSTPRQHWRTWFRQLNRRFDLDVPDAAWERVIKPLKKRTVADVCEFLAGRARAPIVRPVEVFGTSCRGAGAFLTLRGLLHRQGVDVTALRPSATVEALARRNWIELVRVLNLLAPGRLPLLRLSWRAGMLSRLSGLLLVGGFGSTFFGCLLDGLGWTPSAFVTSIGAAAALAGILLNLISPDSVVSDVEFGGIRTIGDACRAIAAEGDASPCAADARPSPGSSR
ncbi:MAG: hypothetical protein FLDDKLPJ_02612 [Phycisphaerae bacterium]|nr:hypothetical protein [Phycisphaerae bacterium]